MNRIERYLGSVVVAHALLVMLVIMVIFAFFEFMNQLGDVNESYTLGLGALYTLLKVPVYSYEVFPIVLLIGTLMGLGSLANQSELTVLRVTGWSIKRILFAVLKTAFIIWLVMLVIGEIIAPKSEAYANKIKMEALNKSLSIGKGSGLWLKDENQFVHIKKVVANDFLKDIDIFTVEDGELKLFFHATTARFDNKWQFEKVSQIGIKPVAADQDLPSRYEILTSTENLLTRHFVLQPEDLTNLDIESRYLSAVSLYKHIEFLEQNDLDASQYVLSFWKKISMPVVVVAMIAVVFPLVFGSMRQVSVGQRIFVGVLIGMSFHLLNQLIGNIAVVYQLPISIAALLPALLVITGSWFWLKKAE